MTNERMQICKIIRKYKTLKPILDKSGVEDYLALQEKFNPGDLIFSDYEFEDDTSVELSNELTEEYESKSEDRFHNRSSFVISIIALLVAIFGSIGSDSLLGRFIESFLK